MKYRIHQIRKGFFPQRRNIIGIWEHFDAADALLVCYLSLEEARAFLDEVVSGKRDKYGNFTKPEEINKIHPYP